MKVLLDKGASAIDPDNYGNTPLLYAAKADKADAIKFLTSHGASINEKDSQGNTAWTLALWSGKKAAAKYLLAEHLTSVRYQSSSETILANLCEILEENSKLVELTLDNNHIIDSQTEAEALVDMLSRNKHLISLTILASGMEVAQMKEVVLAIKRANRSLLYFDLQPRAEV